MTSLSNLPKTLLLATVLTAAAACSSKPVVQDFPATANPTEEITNLENEVKTAESNQVNVLSPRNFKEAHEALEDAKKLNMKGKDAEDTLHQVALGKAYLNNANAVAEVARNNIEDVIAAREAAVVAGAPSYFGKDFKNTDEDFTDLTKDIENNKLSGIAKERSELQKQYLDLELKAIKEKHLKGSREGIKTAKKEKAEKYAPRTLAIAEKSYADTEAYITANRHNTSGIEARAKETSIAVEHAVNINRISQNQKNLPPEELALMIEQEKMRVAAKESQLETVNDELQTTQSALDRQKDATAAAAASLGMTKEAYEAQKRLNEKYETARKEFDSSEAEVYKQGDALLIRLKGMEFPSSKATITERNKPLLNKVQKVMEEFGSSAVTIEGHTDSIGGKKVNDRLSQNRAQAVKDYLQSSGGGIESSAKIEAVGYGYQKPLATNKTADGRAQNRRVDIVIKPQSTEL
ncbi:OmpA family protein [Bacteriovorax stolpii]|uniref:OmpA family protein n=1 Tax=Bacteriovorax stolpii TaxID=960 RepID=UPI00163CFCF3|nr:OmpA family protein [Bacteriovorax stolpii]